MKLALAGVFAAGCALTWWGFRITEGPGSADERMAGSIPAVIGLGLIAADAVVTVVYLVVKA